MCKDVEITQDLLKEYMIYDQETGNFTKIKKLHPRDNTVKVGGVVGHKSGDGYIHFSFFGKKRKAHRMAWLYVYGYIPDGLIDHIDGDKTNNAILNLRLATNAQNLANMHKINSKSGFRGVYESKYKGEVKGYIAQFNKKHLGYFKKKEDAARAFDSYLKEMYGEFAKVSGGSDD